MTGAYGSDAIRACRARARLWYEWADLTWAGPREDMVFHPTQSIMRCRGAQSQKYELQLTAAWAGAMPVVVRP